MKILISKNFKILIISCILLISIVKSSHTYSKNIKTSKSPFNFNVKMSENKIKDNQNILDEMLNYFEKLNKKNFNMEKNKLIIENINENFYKKEAQKIFHEIEKQYLFEYKKAIEEKVKHYESLLNRQIYLYLDKYINFTYTNKNNENKQNEIIKDCVEYGLSPQDENYIICTKYE